MTSILYSRRSRSNVSRLPKTFHFLLIIATTYITYNRIQNADIHYQTLAFTTTSTLNNEQQQQQRKLSPAIPSSMEFSKGNDHRAKTRSLMHHLNALKSGDQGTRGDINEVNHQHRPVSVMHLKNQLLNDSKTVNRFGSMLKTDKNKLQTTKVVRPHSFRKSQTTLFGRGPVSHHHHSTVRRTNQEVTTDETKPILQNSITNDKVTLTFSDFVINLRSAKPIRVTTLQLALQDYLMTEMDHTHLLNIDLRIVDSISTDLDTTVSTDQLAKNTDLSGSNEKANPSTRYNTIVEFIGAAIFDTTIAGNQMVLPTLEEVRNEQKVLLVDFEDLQSFISTFFVEDKTVMVSATKLHGQQSNYNTVVNPDNVDFDGNYIATNNKGDDTNEPMENFNTAARGGDSKASSGRTVMLISMIACLTFATLSVLYCFVWKPRRAHSSFSIESTNHNKDINGIEKDDDLEIHYPNGDDNESRHKESHYTVDYDENNSRSMSVSHHSHSSSSKPKKDSHKYSTKDEADEIHIHSIA